MTLTSFILPITIAVLPITSFPFICSDTFIPSLLINNNFYVIQISPNYINNLVLIIIIYLHFSYTVKEIHKKRIKKVLFKYINGVIISDLILRIYES